MQASLTRVLGQYQFPGGINMLYNPAAEFGTNFVLALLDKIVDMNNEYSVKDKLTLLLLSNRHGLLWFSFP